MADPAVRQTHRLHREGDLITKTFTGWDRDQHLREWGALNLLAVQQPGLAPRPIRALLDERPPSVTMTVIPGEPITGSWSCDQVELAATTLRRLWTVPGDGLATIDMHNPAYWRTMAAKAAPPNGGIEQQAYDLAVTWIAGYGLDALLDGQHEQVLGQGDPQPGNLLYDGTSIRLVDFEDAGASDVSFELANFAEHLGTRGTGLARVADLIHHNRTRYRQCRRLLASFWLFRMLPDPTGVRGKRTVTLHDQASRLISLFG